MYSNVKVLIRLICIITFIVSIGCANYYYKKGQEYLDNDQYIEALLYFRKIEKLKKDYPDLLFKIETAEFYIAKQENSIVSLKRFIEKHSEGYLCEEAKKIIDNKLFEDAKKKDTISAYESYQEETPLKDDKHSHRKDAIVAINRIRLKNANDALNAKNFTAAMLLYQQIRQLDPAFPSISDFIERTEFEMAKDKGSKEAWQFFLKKNPNGNYAKKAKTEYDSLLYQQAKTRNTIEDYKQYFQESPLAHETMNKNRKAILNKMFNEGLRLLKTGKCQLALEYFEIVKTKQNKYPYLHSRIELATYCKNCINKSGIVDYIEIYIKGEEALANKYYSEALEHFNKIKEKNCLPVKRYEYIEDSEFNIAKQANTLDAFKKYKKIFPVGKYINQVSGYIKDLNLTIAKEKNTVEAFQNYLNKYPNDKDSIKNVIFNFAINKSTKKAFDYYLELYPNDKDSIEEGIFNFAKNKNTEKAFAYYSEIYPDGKYIDQVKDSLIYLEFVNAGNNIQKLFKFIKKYPKSEYVVKAKQKILSYIKKYGPKELAKITKVKKVKTKVDQKELEKEQIEKLKKFISKYEKFSKAKFSEANFLVLKAKSEIKRIQLNGESRDREEENEYEKIKAEVDKVMKKIEKEQTTTKLQNVIMQITEFLNKYVDSKQQQELYNKKFILQKKLNELNSEPNF